MYNFNKLCRKFLKLALNKLHRRESKQIKPSRNPKPARAQLSSTTEPAEPRVLGGPVQSGGARRIWRGLGGARGWFPEQAPCASHSP